MKKAFTLIELLIVVAIIAILAAIAVPNFLEAQVRSKVSRVKSDMRSLATALEAYAVDHNKYPHLKLYHDLGYVQWNRGGIYGATPLSTPVAYISSTAIRDPFGPNVPTDEFGDIPDDLNNPGGTFRSAYINYVNVGLFRETDRASLSDDAAANLLNRPKYFLFSMGPDYLKGPNVVDGGNWSHTAYAEYDDPYDVGSPNTFRMWEYDATNGTRSAGDILRRQGE